MTILDPTPPVLAPTFANMCLGAGVKKTHRDTLRAARYLTPEAVTKHPEAWDWLPAVPSWQMHLNDQIGDCVPVAANNAIRLWKANATGADVDVGDDAIKDAYRVVGGWDPNVPNSDNGCSLIDFLVYWRDTGLGGHKIRAWAAAGDRLEATIFEFGCAYLALDLPITAKYQTVWDIEPGTSLEGPAAPRSWGGHCVIAGGFSPEGFTFISWGERILATWRWLSMYCSEAYGIVTDDFINARRQNPAGIDISRLDADLLRFGL